MNRSARGWLDAALLSVGMFTAIRVPTPSRRVDRAMSGRAIVLAPVAAAPLGVIAGVIAWLGHQAGIAPLATGLLAVAALALGSRAFHLDGLADTADALTAWGDRDKRLAILKSGDVGPAGAAALALTLGIQAASIAAIAQHRWGPVLVGVAVCASRLSATIGCVRGIPPARSDGLGAGYCETVPAPVAVLAWLVAAVALADLAPLAGLPRWRALVAVAAAVGSTGWLLRRGHRRFGGMVGDVLGASVEISLALLLVCLS